MIKAFCSSSIKKMLYEINMSCNAVKTKVAENSRSWADSRTKSPVSNKNAEIVVPTMIVTCNTVTRVFNCVCLYV